MVSLHHHQQQINLSFFLVIPGEYVWIPFNISVPVSSTIPIEIAVISEIRKTTEEGE